MPYLFDKLEGRCNRSTPIVEVTVAQPVATAVKDSIGPIDGSPTTPVRGVLET
jgi:hypothetical protein